MYHATKIQPKERGKWLFLFSVLLGFLMCSSAYSQSVVIYEHSNFGGSSKTLSIGDYRLSDFNDVASSIKVPAGLAAMIFEHADDGGGYGISVDLLEDQPDLSKYNFNDKISYVTVFSTQRQGFFWARNSIRNGQFVMGHWERARASGNPVNTVAVVSPPLPPHTPTGPTTIQVNDAQSTITSLGKQTPSDAAIWEQAEADQMGVIGSDYRGIEEIGSAAFQRASNNIAIPDSINFWYPQKQPRDHRNVVYFKRTLSGIVDAEDEPYIVDIDGTYEDHDFTLHIKPSPKYQYLISDGHKPELATMEAIKILAAERKNPRNTCDEPFKLVEAEIDTSARAKRALNFLVSRRIGKQISVYGPWIYDKGHCHQPEIHPAEQIWWSETIRTTKRYYLNLFCDASKRFWWRRQMDDGTKLKPWGAPPIKGTFAIAFETEIGKPAKKFEVTNGDHYNVIEFPNSNKIYNLVYQSNTLISFVPKNNAFKVSYEKVGLKPGTINVIRGFLVIETSVGTVTQIASGRIPIIVPGSPTTAFFNVPQGADPNQVNELVEPVVFKKVEGHYMFTISLTDPENPDYCVQERENLANLQQSLKREEAALRQLQSELRTAPPQEKPRIQQEILDKRAEIRPLSEQVRKAQQLLQECVSRPR